MPASRLILASITTLIATGALRAQYAEGFDSQASANVTIQADPDSTVMFVDYANMTVGAASFSIPEAPRRLAGSLATRGVLLQANLATAVTSAVNILAGTTPIAFSGRYRVSFDAWINLPNPVPSGSTEQLLWGVSVDGVAPIECRHNLALGAAGVYGWLAGENGYSSEDSVICEGGLRLAQRGDQQAGNPVFFNDAFNQPVVGGVNNAPANQWVRVDIDVDPTAVRVYYNGVEFHNVTPGAPAAGFAMFGYEDPFSGVGSNKDAQWGLFDNFRVTTPNGSNTPGSSAIQGTASGNGHILNGGAPPAIACPITMRLRGGPSNGIALINMGFPSPITIPLPFGACIIGSEVIDGVGLVFRPTDSLGNGEHTLDLPAATWLEGVSFGFQYFYTDTASPCGISHTEGLAMTIGS
ncbi:MAG: hypothetical protein KA020_18205 [Planctomycetes bacterium]|jgi:hypothetical protein|nr:hypothetical protein [Planctomycetota bacterium]MCC7064738.1 hypothetical protein [Planctomycetota bacterium]